MATRDEHRNLARELLLAYAYRQQGDEPGRPDAYMDPTQLEAVFEHQGDQRLPPEPSSYLLLPKLTRGKEWWPKLGLFFSSRTVPADRPPLEVATLEVVLVPGASQAASAAGEQQVRCVAFRFEPPTCFSFGATPNGDHDYYHMQFVSTTRTGDRGNLDECSVLPDQFPAFPLRACDFGSLVLALAVTLYGRNAYRDADLDLPPQTRKRLGRAYEELGYWAWGD